MSRERRTSLPRSSEETIIDELRNEFEEARQGLYKAWYDSERGDITTQERTARIREIYRLHPRVADDFEELTEEVVGGEFLTVGQLVAKQARDDVFVEREKAKYIREEAARASAGQKRYVRRTKAQDRRGTKPRDVH